MKNVYRISADKVYRTDVSFRARLKLTKEELTLYKTRAREQHLKLDAWLYQCLHDGIAASIKGE